MSLLQKASRSVENIPHRRRQREQLVRLGTPDKLWNNDDLHALGEIPGSDFEVVDESSLQVSPNEAIAKVV